VGQLRSARCFAGAPRSFPWPLGYSRLPSPGSGRIASPVFRATLPLRGAAGRYLGVWALTIRPSRRRFAARLNSSVRALIGMKRIVQENGTGCGIACAAMIAGTSYARAKRVALQEGVVDERPPYYTTSADLVRLLAALGARAERPRKVVRWPSVSGLSIVGIGYNRTSDTWHWVVYVPSPNGDYVLDPRARIKSDRRVDFTRMHPHRYIPVTRPNNSSKPTPLRGAA